MAALLSESFILWGFDIHADIRVGRIWEIAADDRVMDSKVV